MKLVLLGLELFINSSRFTIFNTIYNLIRYSRPAVYSKNKKYYHHTNAEITVNILLTRAGWFFFYFGPWPLVFFFLKKIRQFISYYILKKSSPRSHVDVK